jgi:hypothetical protein
MIKFLKKEFEIHVRSKTVLALQQIEQYFCSLLLLTSTLVRKHASLFVLSISEPVIKDTLSEGVGFVQLASSLR